MGQVLKVRRNGTGRKAARCAARAHQPRVSLYNEVTDKIIAQLEAGCFPWAQPWSSAAAVPGLPRNAVSGRPYSGINVLILWGAVIDGCYPSQDWLTFRQALAAGGCVRKGERGHTIFYAYARANDPFAQIGKVQVGVDVASVIRASKSSFRVAWVERRYQDSSLAETTRWSAIVTVTIQTPKTPDALRKNPLGLFVNAINWSKELGQ